MHVSRRARIWLAVIWMIGGVVSFPPFFLNIMVFDAPGSTENTWTYVWVLGLIAVPVLAFLGGVLTLLTKRLVFLASPLAGLLDWATGQLLDAISK